MPDTTSNTHAQTDSERRFEALLESAPDGILLVDHGGMIRLVNQRAEALFGYAREELLGRPVEILVPQAARESHLRHRERYAADPHARPMGAGAALEGCRRDGERFPVEISLSPLDEGDGAEPLVITVVRDVTEHRLHEARRIELARSETARLASEAEAGRLRLVQSLFDEALTRLSSPDDLVATALERVRETFGADAAAILLRDPRTGALALHRHSGVAGVRLALDDVAASSAPQAFTERSGVVSPLLDDHGLRSLAGAPLVAGGETAGVVHVASRTPGRFTADDAALLSRLAERIALALARARSLDAERSATAAAHAADARLREILTGLGAVVWEADSAQRRRYAFVSESAEDLLGRPAAAFTTRDGAWAELVDPADRDRVVEETAAAMQAGRELEVEYRVHVPGRGQVWLRERARPVRVDGGAVRLRGVTADVTERRELEARLLQGQKMQAVGQLAGGIAHDFNNLLTVILGFATMLQSRLEREQDVADLGEIQRAAERAQALTGQLLSFSRRHAPRTAMVDLNEAVAGLEPMLRRLLDEDIELTIRLAPRSVLVEADASQLEQVVVNLVVNARDSMPAGGAMRIVVGEQSVGEQRAAELGVTAGAWATLAVGDTGTGMAPEVRDRVFEPFFTTKEPGSGTGLGLATVYGIVDRAGGTIVIESEQGRGTDVAVLLPLAAAAVEEAPEEPEEPAWPRVLVVEDERAVRALVRRVLEGDGWNVLEAGDGREALGLLERHEDGIDLLITDIVMPEMSGPELVGRIGARRPDLPVIFTSGYTDSRLAGRQFDESSVELLRKPFLPDELRRVARAAIGAAEPAG